MIEIPIEVEHTRYVYVEGDKHKLPDWIKSISIDKDTIIVEIYDSGSVVDCTQLVNDIFGSHNNYAIEAQYNLELQITHIRYTMFVEHVTLEQSYTNW